MAYRSSSTSRLPREILNLISRHGSSRQQVRVFSSSLSRWHPSPASLSRRLGFPDLPKFSARGRDIQVLNRPDQFYTFLLDGIRKAKRRIFLASLYIGKEETELVSLTDLLSAQWSFSSTEPMHTDTDTPRSTQSQPFSRASHNHRLPPFDTRASSLDFLSLACGITASFLPISSPSITLPYTSFTWCTKTNSS